MINEANNRLFSIGGQSTQAVRPAMERRSGNAVRPPVFFGLRSAGAGVAVAIPLRRFARVSPAAAFLPPPYLPSAGFAAWINLSIWILNP